MARYKKTYRKKTHRRYRTAKRNGRGIINQKVQRPLNTLDTSIYRFRQLCQRDTIVQVGTDLIGTLNCTFGQCPQASTFKDLYDQYKIEYCEFNFRPRYTNWSIVAGAPVTPIPKPPTIYTLIDKDGATAVTTIAQITEYQTVKENRYKNFTYRFKPGTLSGLWDGSIVVPGGTKISPWIDLGQDTIVHYGMVYGVTAGTAGTVAQVWDFTLYLGLQFRCVR